MRTGAGITRADLLRALDKPRTIHWVRLAANPSASDEECRALLMRMREEGVVKFDIKTGQWSKK